MDIVFAVSKLPQFVVNPKPIHWNAVKNPKSKTTCFIFIWNVEFTANWLASRLSHQIVEGVVILIPNSANTEINKSMSLVLDAIL